MGVAGLGTKKVKVMGLALLSVAAFFQAQSRSTGNHVHRLRKETDPGYCVRYNLKMTRVDHARSNRQDAFCMQIQRMSD